MESIKEDFTFESKVKILLAFVFHKKWFRIQGKVPNPPLNQILLTGTQNVRTVLFGD